MSGAILDRLSMALHRNHMPQQSAGHSRAECHLDQLLRLKAN
jgi:hypothetical protein